MKTKCGFLQAKRHSLLAGFAVMLIAAIFSLALLGCDSDPGDDDKSVSITIKNTTSGDQAQAITGVKVVDVGNTTVTDLVGSDDEYDTSKTVAAGETISFTITPTGSSCNVTVSYGDTGWASTNFATDSTAVTLNFKHVIYDPYYALEKE
jgi:hypothetical protein